MAASSRDMVRLFRALSDPTRVEIVQLVSAYPRNVSELTSLVGVSQPKVSRHLKILRDAGLLNDVRRGKWVWYEMAPSGGESGSTVAAAMGMLFLGRPSAGLAAERSEPAASPKEARAPRPAALKARTARKRTRKVSTTVRKPAPTPARKSSPDETPATRPQKAPAKAPTKDIEDFLL